MSIGNEAELNRQFVDALREVLGLAPLHDRGHAMYAHDPRFVYKLERRAERIALGEVES